MRSSRNAEQHHLYTSLGQLQESPFSMQKLTHQVFTCHDVVVQHFTAMPFYLLICARLRQVSDILQGGSLMPSSIKQRELPDSSSSWGHQSFWLRLASRQEMGRAVQWVPSVPVPPCSYLAFVPASASALHYKSSVSGECVAFIVSTPLVYQGLWGILGLVRISPGLSLA